MKSIILHPTVLYALSDICAKDGLGRNIEYIQVKTFDRYTRYVATNGNMAMIVVVENDVKSNGEILIHRENAKKLFKPSKKDLADIEITAEKITQDESGITYLIKEKNIAFKAPLEKYIDVENLIEVNNIYGFPEDEPIDILQKTEAKFDPELLNKLKKAYFILCGQQKDLEKTITPKLFKSPSSELLHFYLIRKKLLPNENWHAIAFLMPVTDPPDSDISEHIDNFWNKIR